MLIVIDSSPCSLSLRNRSIFNYEIPSKQIGLKKCFCTKIFFFSISVISIPIMLIGINGGYFPAICRVCSLWSTIFSFVVGTKVWKFEKQKRKDVALLTGLLVYLSLRYIFRELSTCILCIIFATVAQNAGAVTFHQRFADNYYLYQKVIKIILRSNPKHAIRVSLYA